MIEDELSQLEKREIDIVLSREVSDKKFSDMNTTEFCKACYLMIDGKYAFDSEVVDIKQKLLTIMNYSELSREDKYDLIKRIDNIPDIQNA
jgi:hypothetical protein